ncbi:squalene cyclase [Lentzea sp. HUAS12]|uniref:squalene cyclase n=1 Tax=Lentzea sp. HUAS12 TaxID=2951806 RepID=UPI00209D7C25|nr:squalene cyclase [Lentzea sp. HUAS12]USX54138.1 squalene cyclase [Lentzea sp. HUAS12]
MRELTGWLLDSDSAVRWQVERDLVGAPAEVWRATRALVATEGFGARLLAAQGDDGMWAGGAFFPAGFEGGEEGQPWTATTWSLTSLREWGLDPAVLVERGTVELLAAGCRWEYQDLPYWGGEVDCCINSWTLGNGVWLGAPVEGIAEWFVDHQLGDGGWNCEWVEGSVRSSFHSTLNSLKGLLTHELATGGTARSRAARERGEEYLLERALMRRLSTGEVVGEWVTTFRSPARWGYSVLNAMEYFRAAGRKDPRMAEAVEVIRGARQADGTWLQGGRHPGRVWFEIDVAAGEPSKWLTLYAARVLRWWES